MSLLEALREAGFSLYAPCGGNGSCGKCQIRAEGKLSPPDEVETKLIGQKGLDLGRRLACRAKALGDVTVYFSFEDTSKPKAQVDISRVEVNSDIWKTKLLIDWKDLGGAADAAESLCRAATSGSGKALTAINEEALKAVSSAWEPGKSIACAAILCDEEIIAIEQKESGIYGVACDIGTTTIACYLLDLATGDELGTSSGMNPQAPFGSDVISRISRAADDPKALEAMMAAVRLKVSALIEEAARSVDIPPESIYDLLLVGNSCMHHLFFGLRPIYLSRKPFIPAVRDSKAHRAKDLGIPVAPDARVRFLPLIASFVGSDMLALLYLIESSFDRKSRLVMDLGTNGEIGLVHDGKIFVTSTAAGPAFEGGRISCGMRATDGAIGGARLAGGDIELDVIGGSAPKGLCGSGLLDVVAALLRAGAIDSTGRILPRESVPYRAIASRIEGDGRERRVFLASGEGKRLCLTQNDVRELQLAKAAIRAASEILLERAELKWQDVEECLLSGAFGSFLSPQSAIAVGMMPAELEGRAIPIGNGAGEGCKRILLGGKKAWDAVRKLREKIRHIPLEGYPEFEKRFFQYMPFKEK